MVFELNFYELGHVMPQMVSQNRSPEPSAAKYVAVDSSPRPIMAAIDDPPDHLWLCKWSPLNYDASCTVAS